MDLGTIARDLTAILAPLLPYLQQLGEQATEEIGSKFGERLWNESLALWKRLAPQVQEDTMARGAVEELARRPEDHRARGAAELQLEKILERDPSLAELATEFVASVMPKRSNAVIIGDGAVAQGSNATAIGRGGISVGRDLVSGTPIVDPTGPRDRD